MTHRMTFAANAPFDTPDEESLEIRATGALAHQIASLLGTTTVADEPMAAVEVVLGEEGVIEGDGSGEALPAAEEVPASLRLAAVEGDTLTEDDLPDIDPASPGRFRAVLVVEDERTADDRIILPGATEWRTPPLAMMVMTKTDVGHDGSEIAGVIETITREGNLIVAEGRFDVSDAGIEAARLVAHKVLTGVSIDGGDVAADYITEEEDEYGNPTKVLTEITHITVLGSTIVPFPAIASTDIQYLAPGSEVASVVAITAAGPTKFNRDWFDDPRFVGPTAIQVTPEGRVFGHMAIWGIPHIGLPGQYVLAPRGADYSVFLTGGVTTQEGDTVPIGRITMDTSHCENPDAALPVAMAHYDHTGRQAAWVNVGEDAFGVWVAGTLALGVNDDTAARLLASALSGDWRWKDGKPYLAACLATNCPGFPVARVRDGEPLSLVAAGYGAQRHSRSVLADHVDQMAAQTDGRFVEMERAHADLREKYDRVMSILGPIVRDRATAALGR